MTDIVKVAGAQIDIKLADKAGNLRKVLNCCREAAEKGARVVLFPELTLTGYNVDDPAEIPPLAESVPGTATTEIQKICRDLDIRVLFGLIEHAGDGSEFYNSAVPYRFVIYQPDANRVELTGSFSGWSTIPMKKMGVSGYWEATVELYTGEHHYSYILEDGRRIPDPTILTREKDDFGGENSILKIHRKV